MECPDLCFQAQESGKWEAVLSVLWGCSSLSANHICAAVGKSWCHVALMIAIVADLVKQYESIYIYKYPSLLWTFKACYIFTMTLGTVFLFSLKKWRSTWHRHISWCLSPHVCVLFSLYLWIIIVLFCVFVCVYECLQNELDWAKKIEKTCFRNPSKLDPVVKSILWSLIHAADNLVYVKRTRSTILTYMGTYLYSRLIALTVGNFSVTCCHHMLPIWICEAEENSEDVPKVNISRRSLVQN